MLRIVERSSNYFLRPRLSPSTYSTDLSLDKLRSSIIKHEYTRDATRLVSVGFSLQDTKEASSRSSKDEKQDKRNLIFLVSLRVYGETTVDTFQSFLPRTLLEYSITLIDRFATLSRDHCLLSIGNHVKVTSLVSRDHPFFFYSPLSLSPIRFSSPERCLRSIPRRDRLLSTFTSDVHRHHVTHHNRTDLTTKRNSLHDEWTHLEIASLQKGEKKEAHARHTDGRRDTP